jgi:DNA-binding transcriptional LysR family regulator
MASRTEPIHADLGELRTFCVAADLGSLGRAAIRLGVSQPALSRRLRGLEDTVGVALLERGPHGVTLTPAGRRLYQHARGLLESADAVAEVMVGLRRHGPGPVRLASSHSATEAFVAHLLTAIDGDRRLGVELVTANSQVVRGLVADGRADIGVAASRPRHTPNPTVRELEVADDAIVLAVPPGHRWTRRRAIRIDEFLATAPVVRDPSSNARWTVDGVLDERGLPRLTPLLEAPTPRAAISQARNRNAPVMLSRHIIAQTDFHVVPVDDLAFPRHYVLVLPAVGEPSGEVAELIEHIRDHVRIWLR